MADRRSVTLSEVQSVAFAAVRGRVRSLYDEADRLLDQAEALEAQAAKRGDQARNNAETFLTQLAREAYGGTWPSNFEAFDVIDNGGTLTLAWEDAIAAEPVGLEWVDGVDVEDAEALQDLVEELEEQAEEA